MLSTWLIIPGSTLRTISVSITKIEPSQSSKVDVSFGCLLRNNRLRGESCGPKAAVDLSRRAWRRPSPYSYGGSEGGRPKPAQRHKIDCPFFLLFSDAETDVQPFPGALFVLSTTVHPVLHTILLWFYRIAMSQGVRGQSGSTSRVGHLLCNDVGGKVAPSY
jgi:hypothetical protein